VSNVGNERRTGCAEVHRGAADRHLSRGAQERRILGEVVIDDQYVGGVSGRESVGLSLRPAAAAATDVTAARASGTG